MGNIYEIGLWELRHDYVYSYSVLPRLIAEKEEVIESLYDDCVPSTVQPHETGMLVSMSVDPCEMAIYIISRKAEYDNMIKRHEGKAKLFEEAMDTLTDRELDVIRVYYFGQENDLNLSDDYFYQVLQEAQAKLCDSICQLQQNKFQLIKLQEREEKLRKVAEFKQAN